MSKKIIIEPSPSKSDYTQDPKYVALTKANAAPIFDRTDPLELFTEWMADARASEPNDSNAMALATADNAGIPDVRMVLLKGFDERGFVFYTNESSAKGRQLRENAQAALCFHWKSLRRQVRVRGAVVAVDDDEADAYFASRARGSQLGAWSSDQSTAVETRQQLEQKVAQTEAKFDGKDIPRPPFWYGWRVVPQQIEFWRDRPYRLHDRLQFTQVSTGSELKWQTTRLYP